MSRARRLAVARAVLLPQPMSCADFAMCLWDTHDFHTFLSELRFLDEYSSDRCLRYMQDAAEKEHIELTGLDTWDYDTWFWESYKESRYQ